jgi:Zn-dependent peptidase ImmA (M78 family)
MRGRERANRILEEFPYTGSNWIYELLDYLGILYFEELFDSVSALVTRFEDKTAIAVDKEASPQKKREYIAHELGHYFFHTGNMILYKKRNPLEARKDERKAQEFALYLLVPEDKLRELLNVIDPPTIEELAEEFGVTVEFIKERLDLEKRHRGF